MTIEQNQYFEAYLPVYDTIPEKWEDGRQFLIETLKKISNIVNFREIGFFLDEELLSGKSFVPSSTNMQLFRAVFRKVVNFGALPNAGTKSVAHGITVNANFTLISMWASATKPTSAFSAIQIPFSSPTLNENIKITLDATNINITTAIDYSPYTIVWVMIEYLLEP